MEIEIKIGRVILTAVVVAFLAAIIGAHQALIFAIVGGALLGLVVGLMSDVEKRYYAFVALLVVWLFVPLVGGIVSFLFSGTAPLLGVALGLALGGIPAYFLSR